MENLYKIQRTADDEIQPDHLNRSILSYTIHGVENYKPKTVGKKMIEKRDEF